jgi:hypothetical protein
MTTFDIRHMAQFLEAQLLDTVNVQNAKTFLEASRRTT